MKIRYDFEPKNVNKKGNIVLYIVVSLVLTILLSIGVYYALIYGKFNGNISSGNRSNYLSIFASHCSIVFLTTSLMAMLSENDRYVYWVEMITSVLIYPRFLSFLSLVVYSISTVVWAMVGLFFNFGWVVIGSFLFGLVAVTILFSRMVAIYYQKSRNKEKVRKFLLSMVCSNDYEKYVIRLNEVTLLKADKRDFYDVYDNLELIEDCILEDMKYKGKDYERIEERKIPQPKGFLECLYIDLLNELSLNYCQEVLYYIEKKAKMKQLCYIAYPITLNGFLINNRKDLFFRYLNKWSFVKEQNNQLKNYLLSMARTGDIAILAEYFSLIINSFNHELKIENNEGLYEDIIKGIYEIDRNKYEQIMSFNGNRLNFYTHYYDVYKEKEKNEQCLSARFLAVFAETSLSEKRSTCFFEYLGAILDREITEFRVGQKETRDRIRKETVLNTIVSEILTGKEIEDMVRLLDGIISLIEYSDSEMYKNVGNRFFYFNKMYIEALYKIVYKEFIDLTEKKISNPFLECTEKLENLRERVIRLEEKKENIW